MSELKPCPFCGGEVKLPQVSEVCGTHLEFGCDCGTANVSIQICDLIEPEERRSSEFIDHKYKDKFIIRALKHGTRVWNTRISVNTRK